MNSSVRNLLVILILVALIWIFYKIVRKRLKHKVETITCFTGGLGSGKTLLSVDLSIRLYQKQLAKYKRRKFFNRIRKSLHIRQKFLDDREPILLTSIPVMIRKYHFKKGGVMSYQLKKEHLLLQERIPCWSVVMIDEIGAFASQMDFKNKNVIKVFDEFVRFFRHYTKGGYIVANDQCSENLNYVVRRRITTIHNLSNCFVFWRFCFHYERNMFISEEIKTIDMRVNENESYAQDNMDFRFKILRNRKSYDTFCYSERYESVPYKEMNLYETLKCFKLLACPSEKEKTYSALTCDDKLKND